MNLLGFIDAGVFETIGLFAGLSACVVLAYQVYKEYINTEKSSLSMVFVLGWIFIYLFWGLYGIRFHTIALSLTNGIALILQLLLTIIVLKKNKKKQRYN